MIESGDRIVAGISGGADSVCLFFALLELQKEMDFAFYAVHINHGYRGEASDRDEQFVRDFLKQEKVLLVHGRGFNWKEPDHFRIVYLPRVDELAQIQEKMTRFLSQYRR